MKQSSTTSPKRSSERQGHRGKGKERKGETRSAAADPEEPTLNRYPVLHLQAVLMEERRLLSEPPGFIARNERFLSRSMSPIALPLVPKAEKGLYFGLEPLTGCHMPGVDLHWTPVVFLQLSSSLVFLPPSLSLSLSLSPDLPPS